MTGNYSRLPCNKTRKVDTFSFHCCLKMQASRLLRSVVISLSVIVCATTVFGSSGGNELLTPAEQLWLEENRSRIVLAVETAYPPFVFLDFEKQPSGLAHDYLLLLQSRLGVQFKQKQFSSLESIFAEVRAGAVQIVKPFQLNVLAANLREVLDDV